MYKLLTGADPEVFATKRGRFVSAHGLIPGDKANPHPVNKGAVQVDGMALEFNIDPATNEDMFVENLQCVMEVLAGMVPDHKISFEPVAEFSRAEMKRQPAEALILGCEADFNAYTAIENPAPNGNVDFRSAAGHVHIGWTEGVDPHDPAHFKACTWFAKELDCWLGCPSLYFDTALKRRELYGKLGAFRPKSYGMEYRTLSNAWLQSEDLMRWVHRGVQSAWDKLMSGDPLYPHFTAVIDQVNALESNASKAKIKRVHANLDTYAGWQDVTLFPKELRA